MSSYRIYTSLLLSIAFISYSCTQHDTLDLVTVEEFSRFVSETGYITDAEKYDWSIVQKNVFEYDVLYGIDWRCPNGLDTVKASDLVTQVSYNDATAYAEWLGASIPSYEQYWACVASDNRPINKNSSLILNPNDANIIGNIWEITSIDDLGRIRLAGGSYLCNDNTCNGTNPNRILYVDPTTGNSHIGIAVLLQ